MAKVTPDDGTKFASSTQAAMSLSSIMHAAVKKVFPRKTRRNKSAHKSKHAMSYSPRLQIAKRIHRKVKRLFDKDSSNINRRQNYIIEKKKYRKAIYRAKEISQELMLNRLSDLEHSDPKRFWADINRIMRPKDDSVSYIEPRQWLSHFQTLLRPPRGEQNQ